MSIKPNRFLSFLSILFCIVLSSNAFAVIDTGAAVVKLRHVNQGGCNEGGVPLNNCFSDLASLNSWISTRAPSSSNPLLVEIGPGIFGGTFTCSSLGNITLRGSGRTNTTIGSAGAAFTAGMTLTNCTNLNVSSLKVVGTYGAIQWTGTGTTTWTDVDVVGQGRGWYETDGNCAQTQTKHYWFSSRIEAQPLFSLVIPYNAYCGESWFFGSELLSSATSNWGSVHPIVAIGKGEAHIYGSVLRTLVTGTGNATVNAAYASNGGHIHIHGTGIDIISNVAVSIAALRADTGGVIHANGAAYNLKTAGGTVTRIVKDLDTATHIHAPYLWEEHSNPPTIVSANGADMAVVTDANQPHLLIYSANCTSKWFDTSTNTCR